MILVHLWIQTFPRSSSFSKDTRPSISHAKLGTSLSHPFKWSSKFGYLLLQDHLVMFGMP
jgi:hypothetical protein